MYVNALKSYIIGIFSYISSPRTMNTRKYACTRHILSSFEPLSAQDIWLFYYLNVYISQNNYF